MEGIIGPTGDLACETQALLAAESAPVSSDFPDKVPPLHIKELPDLQSTRCALSGCATGCLCAVLACSLKAPLAGLQVLADLPALGWAVSAADLAGRRDLRADRVFSIDPPTARDLDDALSVERLPGGDLRVGVHIADVSHFVRCGISDERNRR